MWAVLTSLYVSAIIIVGALTFRAVELFEPNRRLAVLFKCAIIAAGAAAIVHHLLLDGLLAAIGIGRLNTVRLLTC